MAYITAENVSIGYENRTILKNVNFKVEKGDYLCIVGENGSGKTTLMKTILGLLQPIEGEIRFGDDLKKTEIGYLPQQTVVQRDFPASVEEIVISGCQGRLGIRPFYNKKEKELAEANMKKMHILRIRKKCYRELSGGQQQRVLLARALCATQKLLLLDEPVAGLDPKVTAGMYELISQLNREGITIIMISHDIASALKDASHILHVDRNIFYGTKEEYIKTQKSLEFFINNSSENENEYDDFSPDELEMPEFIRPEMLPDKAREPEPSNDLTEVMENEDYEEDAIKTAVGNKKKRNYVTADIVFEETDTESEEQQEDVIGRIIETNEKDEYDEIFEIIDEKPEIDTNYADIPEEETFVYDDEAEPKTFGKELSGKGDKNE